MADGQATVKIRHRPATRGQILDRGKAQDAGAVIIA